VRTVRDGYGARLGFDPVTGASSSTIGTPWSIMTGSSMVTGVGAESREGHPNTQSRALRQVEFNCSHPNFASRPRHQSPGSWSPIGWRFVPYFDPGSRGTSTRNFSRFPDLHTWTHQAYLSQDVIVRCEGYSSEEPRQTEEGVRVFLRASMRTPTAPVLYSDIP
jgi:hypothetical protein